MIHKWYYTPDGKTKCGPFSFEELQRLALSGQLLPRYMARRDEMPMWLPAGKIEGLFDNPPSATPAKLAVWLRRSGTVLAGWLARSWAAVQLAVWLAWKKIQLLFLLRRSHKLERRQTDVYRTAGVRLVSAAEGVPEYEELIVPCRQLCQFYQLALDAGRAGDRAKRLEAKRLAQELNAAYVAIGRRGLESRSPFTGADELRVRLMQIDGAIALNDRRIAQARQQWYGAKPRTRRIALAASICSLCLLVLLVAAIVWPSRTAPSVIAEGPAEYPPPAALPAIPQKKEEPAPPRRLSLPELFAKLAPSVPLVEALGVGTGTGILVEHDGKFLVFTNRHVIENARQGVVIHFLGGAGAKPDQRFSVPKEQTRVVGIHRGADLAVLDISAAAKEIRQLKIEALRLAPTEHRPLVGEEVFTIGHPGVGASSLLTSTLSKGIVSAVGRKQKEGTFLQVTVPMNPGNSGGPLFDYDGRVVGVCTFSFRSNEGSGITLEALNFALESDFVHELMKNASEKSLDAKAIAAVVNPPLDPLEVAMNAKKKGFESRGYSRVLVTSRIFRLSAHKVAVLPYPLTQAGELAVTAVSRGTKELHLTVADLEGTAIASDTRGRGDPEVTFRVAGADTVAIVVQNRSDTEAMVVLSLLEK